MWCNRKINFKIVTIKAYYYYIIVCLLRVYAVRFPHKNELLGVKEILQNHKNQSKFQWLNSLPSQWQVDKLEGFNRFFCELKM